MTSLSDFYQTTRAYRTPQLEAFVKTSGIPASEMYGRIDAALQIHDDFDAFSDAVLSGVPMHKHSFGLGALRGIWSIGRGVSRQGVSNTAKSLSTAFKEAPNPMDSSYKGIRNWASEIHGKFNDDLARRAMGSGTVKGTAQRGQDFLASADKSFGNIAKRNPGDAIQSNNWAGMGRQQVGAPKPQVPPPGRLVEPDDFFTRTRSNTPSNAAKPEAPAVGSSAPQSSYDQMRAAAPNTAAKPGATRPEMAETPAVSATPAAPAQKPAAAAAGDAASQEPMAVLANIRAGTQVDKGTMSQLNAQLDQAIKQGQATPLPKGNGHSITFPDGTSATRYNNGSWVRSNREGQRTRVTADGTVSDLPKAPQAAGDVAPAPTPVSQAAGDVAPAPTPRPQMADEVAPAPTPGSQVADEVAPAPKADAKTKAKTDEAEVEAKTKTDEAEVPAKTQETPTGEPQAVNIDEAVGTVPQVGKSHMSPDGVIYPPSRNLEEVKIRESIDMQISNEIRNLDINGVVDPRVRLTHLKQFRRKLEEDLGVNYTRWQKAWVPGGGVMGALAGGAFGAATGAYGASELGIDPMTGAVMGGLMGAVPSAAGGAWLGRAHANRLAGAARTANPFGRVNRATQQAADVNPLTGANYTRGLPPAATTDAAGDVVTTTTGGTGLADMRAKAEAFIKENPLLAVGGAGLGTYALTNNGQQGQPIVVTQGR